MSGFKETENEKDCTSCKFFYSWFDVHGGDDDLEPTEYGQCTNDKNKDLDESFGEGSICNWHEVKK